MNEQSHTYEVFCIHQQFAVNLGMTWCIEGHYPCTPTYPTLFEFERRPVPGLPQDLVGEERGRCGYTDTNPREWTDGEIDFIQQLRGSGYTLEEIAEAVNRSITSVSIKIKRIGKKDETYNDKHRTEKYEANADFAKTIRPKTILDAYCGTESFWLNHDPGCKVTTNDIEKSIDADYHMAAERLVAKLYAEGCQYDIIDLDPFGSAYDCFDLAIRMAKKGIIITFGEMGHKRWKRLDFVRSHYGIDSLSDFTTRRLIEEFIQIGRRHKKECVPFIVKEWPRISRVYFKIRQMKITEQWDK